MNAILGYSEMLIEDQAAGPVRDDLGKIETAGRNLLGLINEILDPRAPRARGATWRRRARASATTCARR